MQMLAFPAAGGASRAPSPRALLAGCRVLPVLTVGDVETALPLVEALAGGGLRAVEVTLRTKSALEVIEAIRRHLPEVAVGAGSVRDGEQLAAVATAGAQFAVSPGLTGELVDATRRLPMPLVPGVATVSEAMVASNAGFSLLKLFPAELVGGIAFLRAIAGPLPDLRFCPTGGIDGEAYREFLAEPNVFCVGGSWMVPRDLVEAGAWSELRRRAAEVAG